MTAETQIIAALKADSGVGAKAGDRIYTTVMPQNVTLPAVSMQRITADHGGSLGGDTSNKSRIYIQIDCWGRTPADAYGLAEAVRVAMRSLTSNLVDSRSGYEYDTEIHRVSYDFYVWE